MRNIKIYIYIFINNRLEDNDILQDGMNKMNHNHDFGPNQTFINYGLPFDKVENIKDHDISKYVPRRLLNHLKSDKDNNNENI